MFDWDDTSAKTELLLYQKTQTSICTVVTTHKDIQRYAQGNTFTNSEAAKKIFFKKKFLKIFKFF